MIGDNTVNHRPGVIVRAANIVLGLFAGLSLGLFFLLVVRHGWAWPYLVLLALAGVLAASITFPNHIRVNLTLKGGDGRADRQVLEHRSTCISRLPHIWIL